MNYLQLLHVFRTTSVSAKRSQLSLIQPQSFSKQVSGWMLFMYSMFLNVVERIKWKTNFVIWICLVVACGPMESLKNGCEQIQETKHFSRGKSVL